MARAKALDKDYLIQYLELSGVGNRNHYGNEKPAQAIMRTKLMDDIKLNNRKPVNLPNKGKLVVAGYLFTKKFGVVLDSIDKMAIVIYDLTKEEFNVISDAPCNYDIIRYK